MMPLTRVHLDYVEGLLVAGEDAEAAEFLLTFLPATRLESNNCSKKPDVRSLVKSLIVHHNMPEMLNLLLDASYDTLLKERDKSMTIPLQENVLVGHILLSDKQSKKLLEIAAQNKKAPNGNYDWVKVALHPEFDEFRIFRNLKDKLKDKHRYLIKQESKEHTAAAVHSADPQADAAPLGKCESMLLSK